jgi:hypothetical protein
MSASHEIRAVQEFRGVAAQPVGVVVNEDKPTRVNRAHRTTCEHVTEANFTRKVIDGGSATGHSLFFLRFEDAARETGAVARARVSHAPLIREQSSSFERMTVETGAKEMCCTPAMRTTTRAERSFTQDRAAPQARVWHRHTFVTLDAELARSVEGIVATASIDALKRAV